MSVFEVNMRTADDDELSGVIVFGEQFVPHLPEQLRRSSGWLLSKTRCNIVLLEAAITAKTAFEGAKGATLELP
jgi:hypothetical protein